MDRSHVYHASSSFMEELFDRLEQACIQEEEEMCFGVGPTRQAIDEQSWKETRFLVDFWSAMEAGDMNAIADLMDIPDDLPLLNLEKLAFQEKSQKHFFATRRQKSRDAVGKIAYRPSKRETREFGIIPKLVETKRERKEERLGFYLNPDNKHLTFRNKSLKKSFSGQLDDDFNLRDCDLPEDRTADDPTAFEYDPDDTEEIDRGVKEPNDDDKVAKEVTGSSPFYLSKVTKITKDIEPHGELVAASSFDFNR